MCLNFHSQCNGSPVCARICMDVQVVRNARRTYQISTDGAGTLARGRLPCTGIHNLIIYVTKLLHISLPGRNAGRYVHTKMRRDLFLRLCYRSFLTLLVARVAFVYPMDPEIFNPYSYRGEAPDVDVSGSCALDTASRYKRHHVFEWVVTKA